jgi:2-polyprenyl-3-methyl-5-hydroxy-6-metoxy-1,4-benzoquinol methylase
MRRLLKRLARLGFAPARALYYRLLFGRRLPLAGAVAAAVARLERALGLGDVPVGKERWEKEYRGGAWSFLRGETELPRNRALAGWIRDRRPGGAVLDVGCGEGLLRELLAPGGYAHYTGIDLSEQAIAAAGEGADRRTELVVADAESWRPGRAFDAVVFNECLYYFRDPLAVVAGYREWLAPGGVVAVSMFDTPRTAAIARRLAATHQVLDRCRITHPRGSWTLLLLG